MIIITGAAGFIGSCLVSALNRAGKDELILVDRFDRADKAKNLAGKKFAQKIERDQFLEWFPENFAKVRFVFHLGARTDTTSSDREVFDELNLNYSKRIWETCTAAGIPLIYASSAATYGDGNFGYIDNHHKLSLLKPMNEYGWSKHRFDQFVIKEPMQPPFWAGMKFFNVFGPNEYHKGRMASTIFHAFNQVRNEGKMKLFRSHHPDFEDGKQMRDFIYVLDVVKVLQWFMHAQPKSGIYNVGTGTARSFKKMGKAVFAACEMQPRIEYIDTPVDIRDKYQYFTQADTEKLLTKARYPGFFTPLDMAVQDYVRNYLVNGGYF